MGVRGLTELDLTAALEGLARRDFTARELVEAYLAKVDRDDSLVRAYVPLSEAESESLRVEALRAANAADAARKAGRPMPLGGIPVAVKDTYLVEGVRTTFGSGDHVVPQTSALAWQRLSAAGAVLIGKSTTHEYAFGTASGATRNPWDLRRVPGGSSGGSAAALSARMALVALGTDTGGSLRIPAAACGISTLRPTPGRVPVQGTFPLSRTLDVAGPMARRMRDLGTVMAVLTSGEDPSWPASLPDEGLLHGLRIGVAPVISWEGVHDGIAEVCRQALKELERRGAEIIDIPTPYVGS